MTHTDIRATLDVSDIRFGYAIEKSDLSGLRLSLGKSKRGKHDGIGAKWLNHLLL